MTSRIESSLEFYEKHGVNPSWSLHTFSFLLDPLGKDGVSGWLPSPPPRFLGDLAEAAETARTSTATASKATSIEAPTSCWRGCQRGSLMSPQQSCFILCHPVSCGIRFTIHAISRDLSCFRIGVSCRYQAVCAFAKSSCEPGVGVQHRSLRTCCKPCLE